MNGNPSMADVARAAGVSKNAVSLALRHDPQIPPATRERIERVARELGYRYDPAAAEMMSRLRKRDGGYRATIAVFNAHQDPEAFTRHATIPTYLAGCRRRAAERGYGLDTFWLHDPAVRGQTLLRIMHSRGLRGVLLVGMMRTNRIPAHFQPVIDAFPCLVTGVRSREPALSYACADHYDLTLRAMEKALALGYRRPGLVLDRTIDELVGGRFSAGYFMGRRTLGAGQHLSPFYDVASARQDRPIFDEWLRRERPDMIFTLYHEVRLWLEAAGYRVPETIGLAQLERRSKHPDWAGMEQHNDSSGEAAVDMLIGMILRGEKGPPAFPRATLVGTTWTDGPTLPPRHNV